MNKIIYLLACMLVVSSNLFADLQNQIQGQLKDQNQVQTTQVKKTNPKPTALSKATASTKAYNNNIKKMLNFEDTQDFLDAQNGLIAKFDSNILDNSLGNERLIWDFSSYVFLHGEAPQSVNPSLWRHGILNNYSGLFKVVDKVYQVRGADLSNMTIIEAPKGLILIDVMSNKAAARASLDLYYQHRPKVPVIAVIYSNFHVDHFGGIKGVVDENDVKQGRVKIYSTMGFLEQGMGENIYIGNAIARRSMYVNGTFLPKSIEWHMDGGLGKGLAIDEVSFISPTDIISQTRQLINIGGLSVDFYMSSAAQSPSEMVIYFPDFKMIHGTDVVSHTLHNIYNIRGSQVKDAHIWWKTINSMIDEYMDNTEVLIASHHWPMWGRDNILKYLSNQRDMYKSLHDQTLYYANQGYTPTEITDKLVLPVAIFTQWYNRGYYGSISHNVKGIYQRYLGWFDGNPANLNPLPASLESKKYVEAFGGVAKTIMIGQKAYNEGDYRWAATVLKHVIFVDSNNAKAKELLAKSYEQMGYQSESSMWRNTYLMGAYELRNGKSMNDLSGNNLDVISSMSIEMFFDYFAISLNPEKLRDVSANFNWIFSDTNQRLGISINHSVFTYSYKLKKNPDATIIITKPIWDKIISQQSTLSNEIANGNVKVEGSLEAFKVLAAATTKFDKLFNIVTP